MPLPQEQLYTIKDIYNLPEGIRAELIDSHIYYMAPPSRTHQKLVMELSGSIRDYIRKNNGSCEVYPAPFAVHLDEKSNTYVEPDISIICDLSKLNEQGCNRTGSLKSCHLPAAEWTTLRNCLNIDPAASVNIGSWIQPKIVLPFGTLKQTIPRISLFPNRSRLAFTQISSLTFPRSKYNTYSIYCFV